MSDIKHTSWPEAVGDDSRLGVFGGWDGVSGLEGGIG